MDYYIKKKDENVERLKLFVKDLENRVEEITLTELYGDLLQAADELFVSLIKDPDIRKTLSSFSVEKLSGGKKTLSHDIAEFIKREISLLNN